MSILPPRTSPTETPPGIGSTAEHDVTPTEVRVVWRALTRRTEDQFSRVLELRATLHQARIRLERLEDGQVIAAVVIPCTCQSVELSRETGTLVVHCWTASESTPESPSLRLAMDEDGLVVLRTGLLERLGVEGGTHDLVSVTIDN
jgi:hypothetical protein